MTETTMKCRICGKPYKVYSMYAGDQSACPACRRAADEACKRDSTAQERWFRRQAFGAADGGE